MNIYFSGSIRGGRSEVESYRQIILHLKKFGKVLTAYIGDPALDPVHGEVESDAFIWGRDVRWVQDSDILVAEITQPSLGVGYEIAMAHENHVPVLALYHQDKIVRPSAMVAGDPNVTLCPYLQIENVLTEIDQFFQRITLQDAG